MASKKDTSTEFTKKLLAVLEAQRGLGNESYPLTLQRLVELADPQAPFELVKKAVAKKAFKARAVLTSKTNPAGLVVLAEDLEQLAASPRLLEFALETVCTPASPLWLLSKVKAVIEIPKLRKPFEEAIARQIRDNTLPPAAGCRLEKNQPLLFLHRIPPPKKAEEDLAEKLLKVLPGRQNGR